MNLKEAFLSLDNYFSTRVRAGWLVLKWPGRSAAKAFPAAVPLVFRLQEHYVHNKEVNLYS